MKVITSTLKEEVLSLNQLIKEYEKVYLNLYNEFFATSFSWQDSYQKNFTSEIEKEKKQVEKMINELTSIKDIYNYIIEKYETIGQKIIINVNTSKTILKQIDGYIEKLDSIIQSYNNLDTSFCKSEKEIIEKERNTLEYTKKKMLKIKTNIKSKIDNIERIERELKNKLSKINIELVKDNNLENCI
ncbi:MAG TPA: hypothetical protein IAB35_03810 [Candidatus Faecimonas gallistercoris]|nr:hypothetical protein [Candidatus Faecimonas gallistercoris]